MTTSSSSPEVEADKKHHAPVVGVKESLVTIDVSQTPVMKNEVGYVIVGEERLKAEVLRVQGGVADMQVFEDTSGVKVGDSVELSGEMLSAALGPGRVDRNQRHAAGNHDGSPHALHGPEGDQAFSAPGHGASQRSQREQANADAKNKLQAKSVAQRSAQQDEG